MIYLEFTGDLSLLIDEGRFCEKEPHVIDLVELLLQCGIGTYGEISGDDRYLGIRTDALLKLLIDFPVHFIVEYLEVSQSFDPAEQFFTPGRIYESGGRYWSGI